MKVNQVNTVIDVCSCVSDAIDNRDIETLEQLHNKVNGWLASETDRVAICNMIESAINMIDECIRLEEDQ